MRRFFSATVVAFGILCSCTGPTQKPSNPADLAAFGNFGAAVGLVEAHYVTPIDIRRLLVLALLGIERQPSPAQSATQPIVQSAIADIQAMPADHTLPPMSSLPAANADAAAIAKSEQINPFDKLAKFGETVTMVSALPGAPSAPQLLQAATVSMIDGIDPVTHYIPDTSDGAPAIVPPATRWCLIGNIFYVHVFSFGPTTPSTIQLMYSLATKLSGGKLGGVILDLRANSGGLLYMTADVAGLFLPHGAPIATIVSRPPQANETLTATSNDITNDQRIVVLVNKQTSDGAEVVAGALKFNHRAVLLGATTAGSGFVRTVIPLPGSGHLFLVTGQIILPSGQPLQSNGIVPDITVEQPTGSDAFDVFPAGEAADDANSQHDRDIQAAVNILVRH